MKYGPLALLFFALAMVPVRGTAQAAPTPQALFRQGENEYAAGRYEVAIELWERAYAMDPRAGLQYNLAQAYGRTGMLLEERRALELFLTRLADVEPGAMNGPDAMSARARIAAIEERVARTAIVLRGVPRHAVITLDGVVVSLEVDRLRVQAGSHSVEVELPGFQPFTTTVTVAPAAIAEVHVELVPAVVPERVVREASAPSARVAPNRPSRAPEALLVTGSTLVVVGSVLGGLSIHHSRGVLRGTDEAEQGRAFGIAADVTLSIGGALAATGLVLVLVRDDGEDTTEPTPTVALGASRSLAGTTIPTVEVTW